MNKTILFLFLFINSGLYNDKKRGDYQEWRRMGLRMFWAETLSHATYLLSILFYFHIMFFFHSRSRSRVFLGMKPLIPVFELWELIFSFPYRSPILGIDFSFPSIPNYGNVFFSFPSRSRTSGMELSFPFPNS